MVLQMIHPLLKITQSFSHMLFFVCALTWVLAEISTVLKGEIIRLSTPQMSFWEKRRGLYWGEAYVSTGEGGGSHWSRRMSRLLGFRVKNREQAVFGRFISIFSNVFRLGRKFWGFRVKISEKDRFLPTFFDFFGFLSIRGLFRRLIKSIILTIIIL